MANKTAELTIKSIHTPHESVREAVVNGGKRIKWWAKQSVFTNALTEGATAKVEVEEKPNKFRPDETELWVVSVNGQTAQQRQGFGGGRPAAPPRDEDIIVAQVIIKEACESARMNATRESRALDLNEVAITAKALVKIYHDTHQGLKVTA